MCTCSAHSDAHHSEFRFRPTSAKNWLNLEGPTRWRDGLRCSHAVVLAASGCWDGISQRSASLGSVVAGDMAL